MLEEEVKKALGRELREGEYEILNDAYLEGDYVNNSEFLDYYKHEPEAIIRSFMIRSKGFEQRRDIVLFLLQQIYKKLVSFRLAGILDDGDFKTFKVWVKSHLGYSRELVWRLLPVIEDCGMFDKEDLDTITTAVDLVDYNNK